MCFLVHKWSKFSFVPQTGAKAFPFLSSFFLNKVAKRKGGNAKEMLAMKKTLWFSSYGTGSQKTKNIRAFWQLLWLTLHTRCSRFESSHWQILCLLSTTLKGQKWVKRVRECPYKNNWQILYLLATTLKGQKWVKRGREWPNKNNMRPKKLSI